MEELTMNDDINLVMKAAAEANERENKSNLIIPILNGFEIINSSTTNNNFVARYNNYLEQFLCDGELNDEETLDDHIKKVNQAIKESVMGNPLYENHNYIMYYRSYKTQNFEFKIYAQDILMGTKDNLEFVRQLNSYFVNPFTNEFFQLSLAIGPYAANKEYFLLEKVNDFDNDRLISLLNDAINLIMDNINYE